MEPPKRRSDVRRPIDRNAVWQGRFDMSPDGAVAAEIRAGVVVHHTGTGRSVTVLEGRVPSVSGVVLVPTVPEPTPALRRSR